MQAEEAIGVRFIGRQAELDVQLLGACWNFTHSVGAAWMAGPANAISAIAAEISIVGQKRSPSIIRPGNPNLRCDEEAYAFQKIRLPQFNTWQLLFRSVRPSLVIGNLNESMRHHLLSSHFTTPVLYAWVPWIVQEMVNRGGVKPLSEFGGMEAYNCMIDSDGLDEIVTTGLRQGVLRVE